MSEPEDGGHPRGPDDPVGTAAEEAAKLLGAVAEWGREHGSELGTSVAALAGHAAESTRAMSDRLDEHLATGAAECTYCPVCRTVHAVRQTSPEVRAHLATAASSLLQAASGLMATAVPPQGGGRSGGVERIDLDAGTDDEWPEDDG